MSSNSIIFDDHKPVVSFRKKSSAEGIADNSTRLSKPAHISKRAMSLPTDLQNNTVKTKDLFWFLPKNKQRRHNNESEYPCKTTMDRQNKNGIGLHSRHLWTCQELSGNSTYCSVTTSSTNTIFHFRPTNSKQSGDAYTDTDEHDFPLLGLEIVDEIDKENEIHS